VLHDFVDFGDESWTYALTAEAITDAQGQITGWDADVVATNGKEQDG
jgi:hypothetical protein